MSLRVQYRYKRQCAMRRYSAKARTLSALLRDLLREQQQATVGAVKAAASLYLILMRTKFTMRAGLLLYTRRQQQQQVVVRITELAKVQEDTCVSNRGRKIVPICRHSVLVRGV